MQLVDGDFTADSFEGKRHHRDLFRRTGRLCDDPHHHRQARRRLPAARQNLSRKGQGMIGYVTLGSNDLDRARDFYDELMPVDRRRADHGVRRQWFTMYGTGMGKPGLAVSKPYNGSRDRRQRQYGRDRRRQPRPRSTRSTPRRWSSAAPAKARRAFAARKATQAFYGAYFRDLDGNKLAAFRIGPAD